VLHRSRWGEQCREERQTGLDGGWPRVFPGRRNTGSPERGDDAHERVLLLGVREVPCVVFRGEAGDGGEGPHLDEVYLFRAVCLFAVADSGAGRGELDVAAFENFDVAH